MNRARVSAKRQTDRLLWGPGLFSQWSDSNDGDDRGKGCHTVCKEFTNKHRRIYRSGVVFIGSRIESPVARRRIFILFLLSLCGTHSVPTPPPRCVSHVVESASSNRRRLIDRREMSYFLLRPHVLGSASQIVWGLPIGVGHGSVLERLCAAVPTGSYLFVRRNHGGGNGLNNGDEVFDSELPSAGLTGPSSEWIDQPVKEGP